MAISRMQQPRQMYGLGGLLKKAARGIKKVVKSPLGKAAIIGGLGMIPFGAAGSKASLFSRMMGSGGGGGIGKFFTSGLGRFVNPMSGAFGEDNKWKHALGLAGAGMIAAPFIQKAMGYGPYEEVEEEIDDWTVTPSSIANIRNMARLQDPSLAFLPSSNYTQSGFYAADGGRVGLLNGGGAGEAQMEQMLRAEYMKYRNKGGTMPYEQFKILVMKQSQQGQMPNQMMAADGGRAGYLLGGEIEKQTDFIGGPQGDEEFSETVVEDVGPTEEQTAMVIDMIQKGMDASTISSITGLSEAEILAITQPRQLEATGGRVGAMGGGLMHLGRRLGYENGAMVEQETDFIQGPGGTEEFDETLMASDPGAGDDMNQVMEFFSLKLYGKSLDQLSEDEYLNLQESLPDLISQMSEGGDTQFAAQGGRIGAQEGGLMDLGGQEKDYRDEGGFVALGGEERADDVPARLSKNEFVFTADAVRAAGGGDIDRGSEVMQNVMDNLEQGGEVSEDSQGLEGGEEIMSEEIIDESNPAQGMYENYEQLQSRVA